MLGHPGCAKLRLFLKRYAKTIGLNCDYGSPATPPFPFVRFVAILALRMAATFINFEIMFETNLFKGSFRSSEAAMPLRCSRVGMIIFAYTSFLKSIL